MAGFSFFIGINIRSLKSLPCCRTQVQELLYLGFFPLPEWDVLGLSILFKDVNSWWGIGQPIINVRRAKTFAKHLCWQLSLFNLFLGVGYVRTLTLFSLILIHQRVRNHCYSFYLAKCQSKYVMRRNKFWGFLQLFLAELFGIEERLLFSLCNERNARVWFASIAQWFQY